MSGEYPECEKLTAVAPQSQAIGEFLVEFLPDKGIACASWTRTPAAGTPLIVRSTTYWPSSSASTWTGWSRRGARYSGTWLVVKSRTFSIR